MGEFRNPALEARKQHKLKLLELIQDNGETPLRKLVAVYSLKTGLSMSRIFEYISELDSLDCVEAVSCQA
jgi:hypothetical protein